MGTPKADLIIAGRRLLDRAVTALREGGCNPVIAIVREGTTVGGVRAVVNPDPSRGMRSSLALAVDAASLASADALAVLLVDVPGIGPDAVRVTVDAWRPGRIAIATFGGRRAHPIVMAPQFWHEALADAGADEGARAWLGQHAELIDAVDAAGDPSDLDTPEDVQRWAAGG
jgi:CTP:molybdopterin cytidylyltransferase MocA